MLKKIPTENTLTGMYIHEFCAPWLSIPFWRKSFLVASPELCAEVRSCGIAELIIDTNKGIDEPADAPAPAAPPEASAAIAAAAAAVPAASEADHDIAPTSTAAEYDRAASVISRSKQAMTTMFHEARMGRLGNLEQTAELVDAVAGSVIRNPHAMIALSRLKTADDYTYMHSVAVCAMMIALARQLGMDEEEARLCGQAGLLHDIGKMAIEPEILNKPGRLTEQEYVRVQEHPRAGHAILQSADAIPPATLDVCLHHHEKFDGTGYPHGLKGDAISLYARMGAVCDVYDAITSNRPYKSGWCPAESLRRMSDWAKEGHFDPAVFGAFVKCVGIYPIGTLVKLTSGRLAVVIDINRSLLRPIVKTFFSSKAMTYVQPQVIDLSLLAGKEEIVSREDAHTWNLTDIDKYWHQA
ncbi:MAG: HD-GYP domain-containing protein [Sphingomonadaceae bacterium]